MIQLLFHQLFLSPKLITNVEKNSNKHRLKRRARAEKNLGTSEFTCKNDVVVREAHFRTSVVSDLTLPKFSDCKRQHIVNFLEELDSYFQLKDLPAIANCDEIYY